MQGFETIINSIIKLGIAMLVGFVCIKTGYITKEQNNGLSKVIVRVTLPILIITSLTSLEFDTQKLKNSIYVLLVSIVVVAFLFAVGTVTSKISKMDKSRAIMRRVSVMLCLWHFRLYRHFTVQRDFYMRRFMNLQTILVFGRSACIR